MIRQLLTALTMLLAVVTAATPADDHASSVQGVSQSPSLTENHQSDFFWKTVTVTPVTVETVSPSATASSTSQRVPSTLLQRESRAGETSSPAIPVSGLPRLPRTPATLVTREATQEIRDPRSTITAAPIPPERKYYFVPSGVPVPLRENDEDRLEDLMSEMAEHRKRQQLEQASMLGDGSDSSSKESAAVAATPTTQEDAPLERRQLVLPDTHSMLTDPKVKEALVSEFKNLDNSTQFQLIRIAGFFTTEQEHYLVDNFDRMNPEYQDQLALLIMKKLDEHYGGSDHHKHGIGSVLREISKIIPTDIFTPNHKYLPFGRYPGHTVVRDPIAHPTGYLPPRLEPPVYLPNSNKRSEPPSGQHSDLPNEGPHSPVGSVEGPRSAPVMPPAAIETGDPSRTPSSSLEEQNPGPFERRDVSPEQQPNQAPSTDAIDPQAAQQIWMGLAAQAKEIVDDREHLPAGGKLGYWLPGVDEPMPRPSESSEKAEEPKPTKTKEKKKGPEVTVSFGLNEHRPGENLDKLFRKLNKAIVREHKQEAQQAQQAQQSDGSHKQPQQQKRDNTHQPPIPLNGEDLPFKRQTASSTGGSSPTPSSPTSGSSPAVFLLSGVRCGYTPSHRRECFRSLEDYLSITCGQTDAEQEECENQLRDLTHLGCAQLLYRDGQLPLCTPWRSSHRGGSALHPEEPVEHAYYPNQDAVEEKQQQQLERDDTHEPPEHLDTKEPYSKDDNSTVSDVPSSTPSPTAPPSSWMQDLNCGGTATQKRYCIYVMKDFMKVHCGGTMARQQECREHLENLTRFGCKYLQWHYGHLVCDPLHNTHDDDLDEQPEHQAEQTQLAERANEDEGEEGLQQQEQKEDDTHSILNHPRMRKWTPPPVEYVNAEELCTKYQICDLTQKNPWATAPLRPPFSLPACRAITMRDRRYCSDRQQDFLLNHCWRLVWKDDHWVCLSVFPPSNNEGDHEGLAAGAHPAKETEDEEEDQDEGQRLDDDLHADAALQRRWKAPKPAQVGRDEGFACKDLVMKGSHWFCVPLNPIHRHNGVVYEGPEEGKPEIQPIAAAAVERRDAEAPSSSSSSPSSSPSPSPPPATPVSTTGSSTVLSVTPVSTTGTSNVTDDHAAEKARKWREKNEKQREKEAKKDAHGHLHSPSKPSFRHFWVRLWGFHGFKGEHKHEHEKQDKAKAKRAETETNSPNPSRQAAGNGGAAADTAAKKDGHKHHHSSFRLSYIRFLERCFGVRYKKEHQDKAKATDSPKPLQADGKDVAAAAGMEPRSVPPSPPFRPTRPAGSRPPLGGANVHGYKGPMCPKCRRSRRSPRP